MFLVWQFFVKNLLSVVLVLFPDIFVNFFSHYYYYYYYYYYALACGVIVGGFNIAFLHDLTPRPGFTTAYLPIEEIHSLL
jgi:hypothetical protein